MASNTRPKLSLNKINCSEWISPGECFYLARRPPAPGQLTLSYEDFQRVVDYIYKMNLITQVLKKEDHG